MAAITDKFSGASNGSRPVPTTVTSTRSSGVTTLQCAALTGWRTTNPVHFATYRTDAQGVKIDSSQCDWKGIVSGTQITNLSLRAGTDTGNAIGDTVVSMPTAAWADDFVDGVSVVLDVDGTLKAGAVDNAAALASDVVTTAKILDSNVTAPKLAAGIPVQIVETSVSAMTTGTTTIPTDDTIPQNTEGTEFMTLAITPKSATNKLVIDVLAHVSNSAAVSINGALFQDATANALAAGSVRNTVGTEMNMIHIRHTMVAGTASATTFKFRAGGDSAGTTTFNGTGGVRVFGAITKSSIVITEYRV